MTESEVLSLLRRKVREVGNQGKAAAELGVSAPFLSDVIADPPRRPLTSPRLLEGLGLREVRSFEPLDSSRPLDSEVVVFLAQLAIENTESEPSIARRCRGLLERFGYSPDSSIVASLLESSAS